MSDGDIKIEVNGIELPARPGQMLIEVTDKAGIYVPRFCYHEKLSVAANCRMCLIEVENAPKPLPACATPVTDGMKVKTKSEKAIAAQKSVMEFLLINHPLDCPICDQGGECELQDLAMGYGRDISRFTERKRVVKDKNIGPLVSTDMTRCILCTRCVRFGEEIAGIQELGTIGRGESAEIRAFIEESVEHELSGNIIDLCPVGALNSKPFRFSARAWEMVQQASIAPHDCLGSNINAHILRGRLKRVVPRANEAINETWLSDRDRFSYEGIYAEDRLEAPMIRDGDDWRAVSWQDALEEVARRLEASGNDVGALVSPSATTEESYLLARIVRHLGSDSIDHRLRRRDFRQQEYDPLYFHLGAQPQAIESMQAVFVVGSNIRKEVPLLAHRVRKAAVAGSRVSFLNPEHEPLLFDVDHYLAAPDLVAELARVVRAAAGQARLSGGVAPMLDKIDAADEAHREIAGALGGDGERLILLGQIAMRHPRFAELRLLAGELARLSGARLGFLPEGANSAGASLAGALPHRDRGGRALQSPGATVADMRAQPPASVILFGIEPEFDCANGEATAAALSDAEFVVALSPWFGNGLQQMADVILPIGTFAETSGTFVNAAGEWQSFGRSAAPVGDSRPGWKVLRVLGNLLNLPDCDYVDSESIRDELRAGLGDIEPDSSVNLAHAPDAAGIEAESPESLDVPMYRIDALVRRAPALQLTADAADSVGARRKIA